MPFGTTSADVGVFNPGGCQAEDQTEDEEWSEGDDIFPGCAASLPPEDDQERRWQGAWDGLAEQCADEEHEAEGVPTGRAWFRFFLGVDPGPAKECERGSEVEHAGEDVFSFGDPGDGLDVDRM